MSTPKSISSAPIPPRQAGVAGLVAAAIVGLQALGCAGVAVFFFVAAPSDASLGDTSHLMFSLLTVLFALGLGLVARGLWRGLAWPRTATVVWLVLLVPVGWSMFQAGQKLVGTLILGSAIVAIAAVAVEGRKAERS